MMLLAIDTSTENSGLALYDGRSVLAESLWHSARHHTEQLVAQLDLMCRHLGATPADLQAVGVATGPGSWAGLRVGMSLAKSLAVARNIPIIGVPTPEVIAWPQRHSQDKVITLIRLGRGRYAVSEFAPLNAPCATPTAATVLNLADLPVARALYLGDLDDDVRSHVAAAAIMPSPADNVRRPAALAEIAWGRFRENDVDDLVALEPIYLSSPVPAAPRTSQGAEQV